MSKILIDRAVVEQALGWFDWLYTGVPEEMDGQKSHDIRLALRDELAEQPAEQPAEQETLAWLITDGEDCFSTNEEDYAMSFPESCRKELVERTHESEAPQPAKREPLTDADINLLRLKSRDTFDFARAIIAAYEAKNGIGGQV